MSIIEDYCYEEKRAVSCDDLIDKIIADIRELADSKYDRLSIEDRFSRALGMLQYEAEIEAFRRGVAYVFGLLMEAGTPTTRAPADYRSIDPVRLAEV